jgi:nucleotide-binding universal stress UspA family protein
MKKRFNILLTTDYSEAGMSAELYGMQFAQNTNSNLYMIHVYDKVLSSTSDEPLELAQTKNDIRELELTILQQHRDKLFYLLDITEKDLECQCIVREGKAGKQICKEAEKAEIDFIVISTNAASAFKEFFFGNQTWNVIKKANVPVLAIPKNTFFTGIENIVFATEYREGEIPVINFLVQFAKQFNAAVTILHITDFILSKKLRKTMFDKFKNEISEKISYDKLDMRVAHYSDIVGGLNDFCDKSKIDILVMSHEKRFFWGNIFNPVSSITRKMTFNTHIPLLSIPDYYDTESSKFWKLFDFDKTYMYEDY